MIPARIHETINLHNYVECAEEWRYNSQKEEKMPIIASSSVEDPGGTGYYKCENSLLFLLVTSKY